MPHLAIGPAMLISSLVGAGSSIAGSALSGKSKTSTSTTTPTLSPELQGLQSKLMGYSTGLMDNPAQGLAPMKSAAIGSINRNYRNMPRLISQRMASRGYGSSGATPDLMYQAELARGGDLSNLEGQFAEMMLNQQNRGASLAEQLLAQGRGQTSTGTSPGDSAGSALMTGGNALSNIASMLMMSKILKG